MDKSNITLHIDIVNIYKRVWWLYLTPIEEGLVGVE